MGIHFLVEPVVLLGKECALEMKVNYLVVDSLSVVWLKSAGYCLFSTPWFQESVTRFIGTQP